MSVTDKQKALRIIEEQPEDTSYEESIRELVFARMIERGLADSAAATTESFSLVSLCRCPFHDSRKVHVLCPHPGMRSLPELHPSLRSGSPDRLK